MSGISLQSILERTKRLTITVDDEGSSLEIVYRPAAFTPEFEHRVNEGIRANDSYMLGWMVCELVQDWDLYEDDAMQQKVPLEPTRLKTMPVQVLAKIMRGVSEDVRPNSPSATPSETGSLE